MTNQKHSFGRYCGASHKAAARMIAYSLTMMDLASMWRLAAILHHRLKPRERAFLAAAVLWSLTEEEYSIVLQHMQAEEW